MASMKLKGLLKMIKPGTNDLVDNGDLVVEVLVISSKFTLKWIRMFNLKKITVADNKIRT